MTPREIMDYSLVIMLSIVMIASSIALLVCLYDLIKATRNQFKHLK